MHPQSSESGSIAKADINLTVSNREEQLLNLRQVSFSNSSCISMLSQQTSNTTSGRHQRQNSTPTICNTSKSLLPAIQQQHEPQRRGLSIDLSISSNKIKDEISQQDGIFTDDDCINRQRLLLQMREVQHQHPMARPGHEQPETLTRPLNKQQSRSNIQQASCQEHDTGIPMGDHPNIPIKVWQNGSNQRHSLRNEFNSNTMGLFQSFDLTTSAGYLDGFGTGHDAYTGNSLLNDFTAPKEMPHGMPLQKETQSQVTRDETQRPQTPLNQMGASQ